MYVCSLWKRVLDTTSRYTYLLQAFAGMKRWIQVGDEETIRVKKYCHRHLTLPPDSTLADPNEILMEFAFEYVKALLAYASDDLKAGNVCQVMCVR